MEVKTTMVYTHALNLAVEGSGVRSAGRGKLSRTRAAGLAGPTGSLDKAEVVERESVTAQAGDRPRRLRPTGTGFIQVSLNMSWAPQLRPIQWPAGIGQQRWCESAARRSDSPQHA